MNTPTSTANGSTTSAVDYVRTLSDEEKGHVLIALLRELIEINGGGKGLISIDTPEGESLGYYVPPLAAQARAEAVIPKLSPEREAELARRLANPGPTLTAQELIAELKARAEAAQKQTP
ncbi:MAG: hypothetical protein L0241_28460 [Planctomycetia bacterium]|nr:hypothetical protein [Planctomycetia bacterium]